MFNQNINPIKLLSFSIKTKGKKSDFRNPKKETKKKRKTLTFTPSNFESNVNTFKIIPKIWMKDLDNIYT